MKLYAFLIAAVSLNGPASCDATISRTLADDGVLTEEDKQGLLALHNEQRGNTALGLTGTQPMAANMLELVWDEDLAQGASDHAQNCVFAHDPGSYGENLYAAASTNDIDNINTLLGGVGKWYDEHEDYDYHTRTCSGDCGHYTQNVWAASAKLGCGYAACSNAIFGFPFEVILVCRYTPPGNFNNQFPYIEATTVDDIASLCPSDYFSSPDVGLCTVTEPDVPCSEGANDKFIGVLTPDFERFATCGQLAANPDFLPTVCPYDPAPDALSLSPAIACPVTCGDPSASELPFTPIMGLLSGTNVQRATCGALSGLSDGIKDIACNLDLTIWDNFAPSIVCCDTCNGI